MIKINFKDMKRKVKRKVLVKELKNNNNFFNIIDAARILS